MFIQTEQTPNPQTLKFLPGKVVMSEGTAFYQNIEEAADSPFARRLFGIDGVAGVFFGSDFITITKNETFEWQVMKPSVLGGIIDHFNSNDKTVEKDITKDTVLIESTFPNELIEQLKKFGHNIIVSDPTPNFGGGQIIQVNGNIFIGGSEPRKDGQAIGI